VASGGVFFPIHVVVWVVFQLDRYYLFALQRLKIWCVTGPGECEVSMRVTVGLYFFLQHDDTGDNGLWRIVYLPACGMCACVMLCVVRIEANGQ
jgi:hypothetical protein